MFPIALTFAVLLGACDAIIYTTEALLDQIDSAELPGATGLSINFNQFSGYLDGKYVVQIFDLDFLIILLMHFQSIQGNTCTIGSLNPKKIQNIPQ